MSGLATPDTDLTGSWGAGWRSPVVRVSSARGAAIAVSVLIHIGLLLVLATTWPRERRAVMAAPPRVRVTMTSPPRLSAAGAAPAPSPAPPRAAAAAPQRAPLAKQRPPVPQPVERAEEPPSQSSVAADSHVAADAGVAAPQVEASSGGQSGMGDGGGGPGQEASAGLPPPPPALSPERRQRVLASYLQEVFRSRIAARFQYPEEAERLALEGLVIVRASVLPTGALWSARTLGACPHRLLCAAAERTVREAAPFPPPPAELGGAISIDVPLNYRLE